MLAILTKNRTVDGWFASSTVVKLMCPPEPMNVLPTSIERWKYLEVRCNGMGAMTTSRQVKDARSDVDDDIFLFIYLFDLQIFKKSTVVVCLRYLLSLGN